jgi:hypothetical protein
MTDTLFRPPSTARRTFSAATETAAVASMMAWCKRHNVPVPDHETKVWSWTVDVMIPEPVTQEAR